MAAPHPTPPSDPPWPRRAAMLSSRRRTDWQRRASTVPSGPVGLGGGGRGWVVAASGRDRAGWQGWDGTGMATAGWDRAGRPAGTGRAAAGRNRASRIRWGSLSEHATRAGPGASRAHPGVVRRESFRASCAAASRNASLTRPGQAACGGGETAGVGAEACLRACVRWWAGGAR